MSKNPQRLHESGVSDERDVIDGNSVLARQKADLTIPWNTDSTRKSRIVDEVLLADGRTLFQCARGDNPCNFWSVNGQSVANHARVHGPAAEAKRLAVEKAEAEAERDRLAAELEARRRAKVEGARRGHETRRQRANGQPAVSTNGRVNSPLETVISGFTLVSDTLDRVAAELNTVRRELLDTVSKLDKLGLADPETTEKAARYDALKGMLS